MAFTSVLTARFQQSPRWERSGTRAAMLLGAALTLSATAALAQNPTGTTPTPHSNADVQNANPNQTTVEDEVTVRASREARHQTVGRNYAGIPIEQVTLTREISYRDIDIHSPSGITTLRERIFTMARDACTELSNIYPVSVWASTNQECVTTAVTKALSQLPSEVAAAVDNRSHPR